MDTRAIMQIRDVLPTNLQTSWLENFQISNSTEISIYQDDIVSNEVILQQVTKLYKAFPSLHQGFFDLFVDKVKERLFTNQQLIDAVDHAIDTIAYPTLQIAQILNYDIKCKLYSYSEVVNLIGEHRAKMSDFTVIKRNGKPYRVLKTDIERFNIPLES